MRTRFGAAGGSQTNSRSSVTPVDKDTVAKYMAKAPCRPRGSPSQTWKTFLRNHLGGAIAIDFLTVPTVTFDLVYAFFVLSLERRLMLHINVTAHPYAAWAAQQIVEAIGAEIVPARLICDRDGIYGTAFDARVRNLGVEQFCIAPRSPWQNRYHRARAKSSHFRESGGCPPLFEGCVIAERVFGHDNYRQRSRASPTGPGSVRLLRPGRSP